MNKFAYFDNSATSFPKPPNVTSAVTTAITKHGGNPGRSGHDLSTSTASVVYKIRKKIADFFSCDDIGIIFTQNCTHALNIALKGVLRYKDHVLTSNYEHNSVLRPLHHLNKYYGVLCDTLNVYNLCDEDIVSSFENMIKRDTRLLIITHASNVTGRIMPIKALGNMCKRRGILFFVDAAQTAGVLPIDMKDMQIDVLCCAGHKSLFGIGGGMLLVSDNVSIYPLSHGGTGTNSLDLDMPDLYPERLEAGTVNVPTICSIGAGLDFINSTGLSKIHAYEKDLCKAFYTTLKTNNQIIFYSDPSDKYVPIIAFSVKDIDCGTVCQILSDNGYYLRGGFMCAAKIHEDLQTTQGGVIRFSPSIFNSKTQVLSLCNVIQELLS